MENNLVSVIIATKNEENNIENCLRSVLLQTYKNIEIIVVDNQSKDRTKEIARKYTDLVFDKEPKRSVQVNYGVNISNGKYILYVDADMILAPELVCCCINDAEKNSDVIGFYIPEIVLGKSFFCKVRRFERSFYGRTVIDAVRFFYKEAFIQINGYDESILFGPDDWDLDRRLSKIGKFKMLDDFNQNAIVNCKHYVVDNSKKWHDCFAAFLNERGIKQISRYKNVFFHNESEFNLKKYLNKKQVYTKVLVNI